MSRRPRAVRILLRASPVAVVAVLVGVLAQLPAGASFVAATDDRGNSIGSSTNFCARSDYLSPVATAWTDQAAPTPQDNSTLVVRSGDQANAMAFVRFDLPVHEPWCVLYAATLRVYNTTPDGTRVIDAVEVDPAAPRWSTATLTWGNQPAGTGGAVGGSKDSTVGQQVWGVTPSVQDQYTHGNNGFLLRQRDGATDPTTHRMLYEGGLSGPRAAQLQLDWH